MSVSETLWEEMFAFEVPTSKGIVRIVGPATMLDVEAASVAEVIRKVLAIITVPTEVPLGVTVIPPETGGVITLRERLPKVFTNGPQPVGRGDGTGSASEASNGTFDGN